MADFGSFSGRAFTAALTRSAPAPYTMVDDPVFSGNDSFGLVAGRELAGVGGAGIEYVDRPVYTPIPPSAEAPGDWPMRFFAAEMEPADTFGNTNTLYVCAASSKLYVRHYEIRNFSGGTVTAWITMAEYPFERSVSIANGGSVGWDHNMILWPGDVIQGHIGADVNDVWLLITGVEVVT